MKKRFLMIISLFFLFGLISPTYADIKKIKNNLSDSVITTKLTAKFTQDKKLNPLKISITTQNGQVTLSGHVNNKEALQEAIKLSKSTRGVKSVNTRHLEIKPVNTYFTDAYITAKVEAAILEIKIIKDESLPIVSINVTTSNGIVTIKGEVIKPTSILLITNKVKSLQGVKRVISKLVVQSKPVIKSTKGL